MNCINNALIILASLAGAAFLTRMFWMGIVTRRYKITSDKVAQPLRILHISDLHCCRYGKKQSRLIEKIKKASPDIICMTGDISGRGKFSNIEELLDGIGGICPCYYVFGNHEIQLSSWVLELESERMKSRGVTVLSRRYGNEVMSQIEVYGRAVTAVTVCGIDDPNTYGPERALKEIRSFDLPLSYKKGSDSFSILLSHRPEMARDYAETKFDLVLSGHAHGGQWRIPFLMNGLYAPHQGLFPRHAGGMYTLKSKEWHEHRVRLCVSRGLARNIPVPRIFNPPELVLITVSAKSSGNYTEEREANRENISIDDIAASVARKNGKKS